jgi:hypothetical protein
LLGVAAQVPQLALPAPVVLCPLMQRLTELMRHTLLGGPPEVLPQPLVSVARGAQHHLCAANAAVIPACARFPGRSRTADLLPVAGALSAELRGTSLTQGDGVGCRHAE